MDYRQVLEQARNNIGPNCKACRECNGLACGNIIPGPGSKPPGNGAHTNWKAWQDIKLNMDVIAESSPVDTSVELFGRKLSLPLITGPVGALTGQYKPGDDVVDFNKQVCIACSEIGAAGSFGDGMDGGPTFENSLALSEEYGGVSIPIINPYSDDYILERIELANKAKPMAVGVVVDSAGLPHLRRMGKGGAKTVEQLKAFRARCELPFIIKGVMTAKAAVQAVEAGADAIIVSNHGGRVLPYAPATAEVLPEIAEAVKGRVKIIVDGGIRSGADIFKALALGADAVMICRPVIVSYYGAGAEGVKCYFEKLRDELDDVMYMCGARKLSDINREMIRV